MMQMYTRYYVPRNSINKKIYSSCHTRSVCTHSLKLKTRTQSTNKRLFMYEILSSSATTRILGLIELSFSLFLEVSRIFLQDDHTVIFDISDTRLPSASLLINL